MTRARGLVLAVGVSLTLSCVASPSITIEPLPAKPVPEGSPVTASNAEEALQRGRFLAVQRFVEQLPRREWESSAGLSFLLGRSLAARGDLGGAIWALQIALAAAPGGKLRPDIEWSLAQALVLSNELAEAARYTEDASSHGRILAPGFARFLRAASEEPIYGGWAVGESSAGRIDFGAYELVQLGVGVNGAKETAVLDTGASYCIVTRSFAQRAGLREFERSDAWGRGLHRKEIPLTFGMMDRLEFAGLTMTNVPAMIMPDDALSFETPRGLLPISVVLGLHLLKEFRIQIDYVGRRIAFTRIVPGGPKTDPAQNLFFARGKVLVSVSADQSSWHPFLLDTGSELTMLTSAGVQRMRLSSSNKLFPREVLGIGRSRVEWGKVEKVSLGIDGILARLTDVVVAEVDESVEDGIVGSSLLARFRVTIDFETMKLSLEPAA